MKILLLSVGFFMLTLFFVNVFAQFNNPFEDNDGNGQVDAFDKMHEIVKEGDRITTEIADLMIEGEFSDEEIDKQLSEMSSPLQQENVVKKLKEKGSDYNGQYITSYNEYLQKEKEKEEAKKKNDKFWIMNEKADKKRKNLVNEFNLNGSVLKALENDVSIDDLLKIETEEDLEQIFKQNGIRFGDKPSSPYYDTEY